MLPSHMHQLTPQAAGGGGHGLQCYQEYATHCAAVLPALLSVSSWPEPMDRLIIRGSDRIGSERLGPIRLPEKNESKYCSD